MSTSSFLDRLHAVVLKQPEKTAILTEGRKALSYADLYARAQNVATALAAGAGGGTQPVAVVGIGIGKSAEYIVAMLGVWLAGAAFVPLDPKLPKERLRYIIEQSKARAVLIREGGENIFDWGVPLVRFDDAAKTGRSGSQAEAAALVEESRLPPECVNNNHAPPAVPNDRLAYIIYTSGSTGRPKGVAVPHRGIVNFIDAQIESFRLDTQSRALFFLSTNFDASISDIGTALLSGATLCIEPEGLLRPGPHFTDLLHERQITHMDIPPSLLRVMDVNEMPASLKTIIIGGEACAPEVVRTWAGKVRVVNVYGPTEATVCTSLGACDAQGWNRPLIGQPMAGVNYHILDPHQKPVQAGSSGELYISGISLADGYVNEPELTASKFPTVDGVRTYRTGDQVVQCPDGEIQFLGRIDRQFKLRGMLIEPEEIESKLQSHTGVERASVLKRPIRSGASSEKLIAFVQRRAGASVSEEELKQHLSAFLPRFMVPQLIEVLDALPLTVTGKADLQQLKTQPLSAISVSAATETPTAKQQVLADIWKKILGIDSIALDDDFFSLGGDSLNVIEAIVAAHLKGITIPPDLFMEEPTIGGLALALESSAIAKTTGAMSSAELSDDVKFSAELQEVFARAARRAGDVCRVPQGIFCTGVTGFLGARVLYELIGTTGAKFYCLVRAASEDEALRRIEKALDKHGKSLSSDEWKRIEPVVGTLDESRFGLPESLWNRLADDVDTVIHSAAMVNMLSSYEQLRPANVEGTLEVARFLAHGRKKHLHYASTLSVFVATSRNTGVVLEADDLKTPCTVFGGYAQTKYAAELLLRAVPESVASISFYRFGLLTGDSKTGLSSSDDFLCMFARGMAALGCAPQTGSDLQVDVTPVDFAARAMVALAVHDQARGCGVTYHIANENALALPDLVSSMQDIGLLVSVVPPKTFQKRLAGQGKNLGPSESAACLALCRCFEDSGSFERLRTMDLFQATGIRFDTANTRAVLGSSLVCPPPTRQMIARYLRRQFGADEIVKPFCQGG